MTRMSSFVLEQAASYDFLPPAITFLPISFARVYIILYFNDGKSFGFGNGLRLHELNILSLWLNQHRRFFLQVK